VYIYAKEKKKGEHLLKLNVDEKMILEDRSTRCKRMPQFSSTEQNPKVFVFYFVQFFFLPSHFKFYKTSTLGFRATIMDGAFNIYIYIYIYIYTSGTRPRVAVALSGD
jgi:hypothetical protein